VSWIDRTTRRPAIRRPRLPGLVVCFVAVVLSGCAPSTPKDPATGSSSASPVTAVTDGSATPRPGITPSQTASNPTGTSAGTSTAAPLPPGTVLPFRSVDPGSATDIRIGLVAPTGSDAFGRDVTESIITQVRAAGAELIRCDPGHDAALALDCARRMATQQVDGWIVLQPGDLGDALCEAGPAEVPLIVISGAPLRCQTASVGADDRRAGFLAGQALGRRSRFPDGCRYDTVVIVTDSASEPMNSGRVEGVRAGLATECPAAGTDEVLLDAGTQDLAYSSFRSALTGLPADADILVAAANDGAALGVVAAIPDSRRDQVTVAAVGADQRARCEMMNYALWIGDAALFPDRYGEVVVPALLDALRSRPIPARIFVQSAFVTARNLGSHYDVSECPVR